ncbi:hypothetical protein HanIR_Chr13g0668391 [Helianthus annuus]|nr:hypothetical protein HanIR_Chr13g0668391 [Helianthus annuus]
MRFVTHLVTKCWGLNALQSANHRDHPCTYGKVGDQIRYKVQIIETIRVLYPIHIFYVLQILILKMMNKLDL